MLALLSKEMLRSLLNQPNLRLIALGLAFDHGRKNIGHEMQARDLLPLLVQNIKMKGIRRSVQSNRVGL